MLSIALTLFIISARIPSLNAGGNIVILSDGNFTEKIPEYSAAVVKFYVPWYVHVQLISADQPL
jgi:hypothetical protein